MLIVCEHCQRQLNLPDEKIPAHTFALTCPSCKGRMEIDPTELRSAPPPPEAPPPEPTPEPAAAAPPPEPAPSAAPAAGGGGGGGGGGGSFEPLPPQREIDKELLAHVYPHAAIAELTGGPTAHLEAGLRLLGMRQIRVFRNLDEVVEAMFETDISILLIALDRATAPPCEPLAPIQKVPLPIRRKTFVALMAQNVRSLDGQTAFYLQMNCLLSSQEIPLFPANLQRAFLFHLRQYRHWGVEGD